jgi:hypothetical protein
MTKPGARQDDEDRMVAYARGELSEAERVEFESRLAAEPRLAAEVERFVELDLVAEALVANPGAHAAMAPAPPTPALRRRRLLAPVLVAAAAALTLLWFATAASTLACTVRAVPTGPAEDLAAYARALGTRDADRIPRDTPRGTEPGGAPATTAADFLQRLGEREHLREQQALQSPAGPVAADFVTIRFVAGAACSAVVLMLDSRGQLVRRYPPSPGTVFAASPNAFAAGAVHALPRPVAVARDHFAVSMHPGFDVPSDLPVPVVWFVTGLRRQQVDDRLLAELDAQLSGWRGARIGAVAADSAQREQAAGRDLGPAVAWLESRGFVVTISTVVRP